jgi:hypothetical protein
LPAADVEVLTTPVRAPWAIAYAERWVGTVRRELLGRMPIFGRRHRWSVLVEYADHDNRSSAPLAGTGAFEVAEHDPPDVLHCVDVLPPFLVRRVPKRY